MNIYLSAIRGIALNEKSYKNEMALEYEDYKNRGTFIVPELSFEDWINNNTTSKFYTLELNISKGSIIDLVSFDKEIKMKINEIYNKIGLHYSDYIIKHKVSNAPNLSLYHLIGDSYLSITWSNRNDIISEIEEIEISVGLNKD